MKTTEVYSWRIDSDLKSALEHAARAENISVSKLLSHVTKEWLRQKRIAASDNEAEQRRIRNKAMKCLGSVSLGEGPYTNERVREVVAGRIKEIHERNRPD